MDKKQVKKIFLSLSTGLCICLLTSCTIYKQSNENVDKTEAKIDHARTMQSAIQPPVVSKPGYYVDTKAVPIDTDPKWMRKRITLRAHRLPFTVLLGRLLRHHNIDLNYDNSVRTQRLISMNYVGTLKGALDALASQTNYHYFITKNDINWSAFQTKTFDISFMPGASNYLVGQEHKSNNNNQYTDSNGSPVNQLNDQQFSNLEGQLSVWHDLERTINQLKSKEGRVVVSESTTSVTVNDHPSNVNAISKYISDLNKKLSRQVAIKVQVLEIMLNKNFNYGVNWNLLFSALNTHFSVIGSPGNATNIIADNLIGSNTNSAITRFGAGGSEGTDVVVNALSQQGRVRVVTEPEVITLNNQMAAIRITKSIGYIESISQTNSQIFSTNSVTPGSITDGFTLYLLPKIQSNKVYLQISSTIANLDRLEKVSTEPANLENQQSNSTTVVTPRSVQYQAIQVPTLSQKSFNQRSLINSGSTLIIAGYKRLRDATNEASPFDIRPLGGAGATSENIETLVLITPIILHSSKSNVNLNEK